MQVGILATDLGPHPAEKWARMTAWMLANNLIEVDEKSTSPRAIEMREARDELQLRLYKVLKPHHDKVQSGERGKLAADGSARLSLPLNETEEAGAAAIAEHVDTDAIVAAVVEEAKVHPDVYAHFSKDETKVAIRSRLVRDFSSVMEIERSTHADGNKVVDGKNTPRDDHDPRDPHVLAFKKRKAPGFNSASAA